MAEIRVAPEKRRSLAWLWLLLLLLIVAGVVYWLYSTGRIGATGARPDTTATTAPTTTPGGTTTRPSP